MIHKIFTLFEILTMSLSLLNYISTVTIFPDPVLNLSLNLSLLSSLSQCLLNYICSTILDPVLNLYLTLLFVSPPNPPPCVPNPPANCPHSARHALVRPCSCVPDAVYDKVARFLVYVRSDAFFG